MCWIMLSKIKNTGWMNTLTKMKFDFGICKKHVCICVCVFVCVCSCACVCVYM